MPSDTDIHQALAALANAGKFEELVASAVAGLKHAPTDRKLLGFLVSGLLNFGNAAGVEEVCERALTLDPENDLALLGLGLAREKIDRDAAQRIFQRLFDRPNGEVFQGPEGAIKMSHVVDIERWGEAHGSVVLEPSQDVTVFDPATGLESRYSSDTIICVTVPHGTIVTDWDYVTTPAGEVLNGSGFQVIEFVYRNARHIVDAKLQKVIHPWPADCVDVDEDALFLSAPPPANFGHWISDFLPRLRAWNRPGAPPLKVATSANLDQHQWDTLFLFGLRSRDIIRCMPGKRYRFRNLTVVRTGFMYRPSPDTTRFLHSKLGPDPALAPKRKAMGRRLLLTRAETTRGRYIANPDDLRSLLDELGFESLRRPEIPVLRQNEIFQDAGIVLGIFGTDIITLYQLRPGTDLVVLYPEYMNEPDISTGSIALAGLCAAVGVRLHGILCKPTAKPGVKAVYYQDLIVDPDALRDCLYDIIERRSLEYAASWETPTGV